MKIRKFAAIDVGSNAIRLLINNVIEFSDRETQFKKSALVRVPVRLGADAFIERRISDHNRERMIETMKAFSLLMEVHGVEKYRACATSAMREAKNGKKLAEQIREEAGVNIEIIDGKKEAAIIASTDLSTLIEGDKNYLYVDVGGGSTEFTVFSKGDIVASRSYKIGTVRLLNEMVPQETWTDIEKWIRKVCGEFKQIDIIGSGGNINKLFKMSGRKIGTPLSYIYLNAQYHFLKELSYDERISELGLNPDRADVIIPATQIYLNACKWSGAKKIHVPKIGLSDGIIKSLYNEERGGV
ncbi:Ppx/GppA phosphatase family protein [Robertkochia aurantiaca]|uniref:Ppx/GppA phosphatase family protein n=1 Tax=Robertkochia aurantiaca TaxID=2873700 RepID=UPI001CCBF731